MSEPNVNEQPEAPTGVACSDLLERISNWLALANHRPWCNVAPGNIYASDGDKCDCGLDGVIADLNATRSNDQALRLADASQSATKKETP